MTKKSIYVILYIIKYTGDGFASSREGKNMKNKKQTKKATKKTTKKLKNQKLDKKQQQKLTELYKIQNQHRSQIAKQAQDYKESISHIIRKYFNNNYIKVISYKECYECGNGSYNYRVFIKSDEKLPKNFYNSKLENDVKAMILVNDKSKNVKCAIDLDINDNYKAF